jgi:hypothetical protein
VEMIGGGAGIWTSDAAVKSDSVEQFRSYLVQEEIDIKLDGALQS